MKTPRPTILLDAKYDLSMAGQCMTDAAIDSMERAYIRAGNWLGCEVDLGSYDADTEDSDGLTTEQMLNLWQAAHDAIRESRPGRWHVVKKADRLRAEGRRIMRLDP